MRKNTVRVEVDGSQQKEMTHFGYSALFECVESLTIP